MSSAGERDAPPRELTAPRLADRYAILERIGKGKSGQTYLAYDSLRGESVAVKILSADNDDVQFRMERGGRAWLRLSHPNLIRVHDVHRSTSEHRPFIVSEVIHGKSLDVIMREGELSVTEAIHVAIQLCDALDYIHANGLIHREIKPANVMISGPDHHVTLLDSGIVREVNPEINEFTRTGVFVGDLAYAAPEQFLRDRLTLRVDLWAVAAVLYDLVCETPRTASRTGRWTPTPEDLDQLPESLREPLCRALKENPRERFPTAADLRRGLLGETALTGVTVVGLHGIRTHAAWQRSFSEVATGAGLSVRTDRWNFGY